MILCRFFVLFLISFVKLFGSLLVREIEKQKEYKYRYNFILKVWVFFGKLLVLFVLKGWKSWRLIYISNGNNSKFVYLGREIQVFRRINLRIIQKDRFMDLGGQIYVFKRIDLRIQDRFVYICKRVDLCIQIYRFVYLRGLVQVIKREVNIYVFSRSVCIQQEQSLQV